MQVVELTDPNGTIREITYDKLGRQVGDRVVTFGSGVDQAVRALQTGYHVRGMAQRFTSYDTSGASVVNEMKREFNDYSQIIAEYQEHAGAVGASSLKVGYTYENGSGNTIRSTGIKYPNIDSGSAASITTAYTSAQSSALIRLEHIKESSTILSSWKYVGMAMVVAQKYDAAANTELTYGSSGDSYAGYDRFGNIVETLWKSGSNKQVHSKYQRNRMGGVVWRQDIVAREVYANNLEDNYYWYDGLSQVTQHERGQLTPSVPSGPPFTGINPSTRSTQEIFGYDQTGNIPSWVVSNPLSDETRQHNQANQITQIVDPYHESVPPSYDRAGNMTNAYRPENIHIDLGFVWDAWNRLVGLKSDGVPQATYSYDALFRRVKNSQLSGVRTYFYNNLWRSIEERVGGTVERQHVWNPWDRWNLIRRQLISSGSPTQTRFVLRDYLDPAAIVTESGVVDGRMGFNTFGIGRMMSASYSTPPVSMNGWNFSFHGEFRDLESGLFNYGYRYYHPGLGRWISRDPIGERGGINLYGFVGNRPTRSIDLLGLDENTVNVDRCQGYLLIAHGDKNKPRNWNLNGACAIGGFVGCWPGANQPSDYLERYRRDMHVNSGVPDSPIWPQVPLHGDELLDGPKGRELGDAMSDSSPENEHNFREAIKYALDAKNEVISKLCDGCCDEVTIIIEVEEDDVVKSAVNAVNGQLGTSLQVGQNKSVHSCP